MSVWYAQRTASPLFRRKFVIPSNKSTFTRVWGRDMRRGDRLDGLREVAARAVAGMPPLASTGKKWEFYCWRNDDEVNPYFLTPYRRWMGVPILTRDFLHAARYPTVDDAVDDRHRAPAGFHIYRCTENEVKNG